MTWLALASNDAAQPRVVLGLSGAGATLTARLSDRVADLAIRIKMFMKPENKCTLQLASRNYGGGDCDDDDDDGDD